MASRQEVVYRAEDRKEGMSVDELYAILSDSDETLNRIRVRVGWRNQIQEVILSERETTDVPPQE